MAIGATHRLGERTIQNYVVSVAGCSWVRLEGWVFPQPPPLATIVGEHSLIDALASEAIYCRLRNTARGRAGGIV